MRILHKPTGIVVASREERSQYANREKAMDVFARNYTSWSRSAPPATSPRIAATRSASADRSEKIRTYNFPDDRITDHRIGKKWHNIEKILEGEFDPIVKAFEEEGQNKIFSTGDLRMDFRNTRSSASNRLCLRTKTYLLFFCPRAQVGASADHRPTCRQTVTHYANTIAASSLLIVGSPSQRVTRNTLQS